MDEAINGPLLERKNSRKQLLLKGGSIFIGVGLFYSSVLMAMTLVEPFLAEDVYTFFGSQLIMGLSGILYGLSLLLIRSASKSDFIKSVKEKIGILVFITIFTCVLILAGYVFFIIPGIVLTLMFLFTTFIVVEEEKSKTSFILKRSAKLFSQVWALLLLTVLGCYILFLLVAGLLLMTFPNHPIAAEAVGGMIVFPVELYLFYRLYLRAIRKGKGRVEK